ncbi:hypothetical protein HFO72_21390 [Rhizobium laguerreae]|uniref:hypothetical protein n=1 Tax=Rhizobium laguerreae TaxID=1076926 RepID=UPI001C928E0A|nr:hypothetical protein [Rhizobium laguerreae]MBY3093329.1 hypothetical protein [Rhizobium laguerreae]
MADFDFRKKPEDERVLVISFDNGEPMSAAQLAAIFKALDADYKQMTGRDLVVARLELGSTWIWLVDIATGAGGWIKDAAGVAKAAQDLGTFAKKLRDGFKSSKASVPLPQTGSVDDSVDRSITAMAKASEKTGSTIRLRKTTITATGTETLDVEVTPPQAKEARTRAKNRTKLAQIASPPALKAIAHHDELVSRMRALPKASGDLEAGIRVMVQATVVNGGRYLLEQVAGTLESEGRGDIATIIRQELEGGQTFVHADN